MVAPGPCKARSRLTTVAGKTKCCGALKEARQGALPRQNAAEKGQRRLMQQGEQAEMHEFAHDRTMKSAPTRA